MQLGGVGSTQQASDVSPLARNTVIRIVILLCRQATKFIRFKLNHRIAHAPDPPKSVSTGVFTLLKNLFGVRPLLFTSCDEVMRQTGLEWQTVQRNKNGDTGLVLVFSEKSFCRARRTQSVSKR